MAKSLEFLPFRNPPHNYSPGLNDRLLLYSCSYEGSKPLFVFDLDRLKLNYEVIRQAFNDYKIHYALKSNSEIEILKTLKDTGSSFETASPGEVERLLNLDVSPDNIIYSNPCKSRDEIIQLAEMGIRYFSFESAEDLDRLMHLVPDGVFALRLNLTEIDPIHINYGASWNYVESKILSNPRYASAIQGLTYYGIHTLGLQACEKLLATQKLPNVKFINIGGAILSESLMKDMDTGMYNGGVDFILEKLHLLQKRFGIDVILEPGTAMIYNVCNGVSRINYINDTCSEKLNYHLNLGPTLGLRKPPDVAYILREKPSGNLVSEGNILDSACSQRRIGTIDRHERLNEGDRIIIPNVAMYSTMYICDFHLLQKPDLIFLPVTDKKSS